MLHGSPGRGCGHNRGNRAHLWGCRGAIQTSVVWSIYLSISDREKPRNKTHYHSSCVPLWRRHVCAPRGPSLSGTGTLREALRICPSGGTAIIHAVPTSGWEQGQRRDSLCLVLVTSCAFSHISCSGARMAAGTPLPIFFACSCGRADSLASCCSGDRQRGIFLSLTYTSSPDRTHPPVIWLPSRTTSSSPAGCGQQYLKEISREGMSY